MDHLSFFKILCFNWVLRLTDKTTGSVAPDKKASYLYLPISLRSIAKWVYIPLVQSN